MPLNQFNLMFAETQFQGKLVSLINGVAMAAALVVRSAADRDTWEAVGFIILGIWKDGLFCHGRRRFERHCRNCYIHDQELMRSKFDEKFRVKVVRLMISKYFEHS